MIDRLDRIPQQAAAHYQRTGRPLVTLTYAQSIDGSIAARPGATLSISNEQTKLLTHQLRSLHDAILVGIGTVLADDPKLTARRAGGRNPQPIILDTSGQFPLDAQLLDHPTHHPWIFTAHAPDERCRALEQAGAQVIVCLANADERVDLSAALDLLGERGVTSLMVEGGAQVITSFLRERLVDQVILTIAPILVGGLRAVGNLGLSNAGSFPRMANMIVEEMGGDLVAWGNLLWEDA